jgi:16S rRNA (guanine527-N7)-methyltransferase
MMLGAAEASALDSGLATLALELPSSSREKLLRYTELLAKWNRTHNLTAIRKPAEMVTLHLLDSLAIVPHLPAESGAALADVGSGAGLPGIPIALARPAWRVTLNDSSEKKAAFLRQAAIELQLENVTVHEGRVQLWKPAAQFAVVVSRAFSDLASFVRSCGHLVRPGGLLAAMKGAYPKEELAAVPAGWGCSRVMRLEVPGLQAERHLVLCRMDA